MGSIPVTKPSKALQAGRSSGSLNFNSFYSLWELAPSSNHMGL